VFSFQDSPKPKPLTAIPDQSCLAERGPWYYEMQELGYNYRITDLQCALGRSQLKRLPEFIARRQEIASSYNQSFSNLDWLKTPTLDSGHSSLDPLLPLATNHSLLATSSSSEVRHPPSTIRYHLPDLSLHLYTVQIDFPGLGKNRTAVMQELREQGVGTQVLYIPVYLQPWYRRNFGYAPGKCPNAEEFYSRALSLPLFPAMNDADVQKVIHAVLALED
jgi:dTDP-4-amino-4,6-dideoxygalactose transaminase